MKNIVLRFCRWLLPLLGFSAVSCDSVRTREEYGTPYADFEVKGRVVDAGHSLPVQGLKVSAMEQIDDSEPVISETTDAEGRFSLSGSFFPSGTIVLKVEDTDGDENGGYFSTVTSTVSLEQAGKGDGWYGGKFVNGDVTVTVSLDSGSER